MSYRSVSGETCTERVIEKSRFLGYCAHVESEEEAKAFLVRLHAEHPAATHICYGYIADNIGNLQRFSDDNEPQGTAGMPILGVIKAQKLFETAVAVVRYFGGIKLGAGGLTRAYAGSASEVLAAANVCEYGICVELRVSTEYAEVNALLKFFEESGVNVLSREFATRAEFVVAVREEEAEDFAKQLLNYVNGRAEIRKGKSYYFPFPVGK